jgi:hypothetical protein
VELTIGWIQPIKTRLSEATRKIEAHQSWNSLKTGPLYPLGTLSLVITLLVNALGAPLDESIKLVAVSAINIYAGAILFRRILPKRTSSLIEDIGCGIALSTVATSILATIISLAGAQGQRASLWFPVIAIPIASQFRERNEPTQTNGQTRHDYSLEVFLASSLVTAVFFTWNFTVAPILLVQISFLVLFVFRKRNGEKVRQPLISFSLLNILGSMISTIFVSLLGMQRGINDFVRMDQMYDEVLAWSTLANVSANPLYAGHELNTYFLTNIWSGDLSSLTDSSPFVVSAIFGVVLGAISIFAILYSTVLSLFTSKLSALTGVIMIALTTTFPNSWQFVTALRIQNVLGLSWLFFFVLLLNFSYKYKTSVLYPLLVTVFCAISLAKAPYSAIALGIIFGLFVFDYLRNKQISILYLASAVSCFLIFVYINLFFFTGSEDFARLSLKFSISWIFYALIPTVTILLSRTAIFKIRNIELNPNQKNLVDSIRLITVLVLIGGLIVESPGYFHLVTAAISISTVVSAGYIGSRLQICQANRNRSFFGGAFIIGSLASFLFSVSKSPLNHLNIDLISSIIANDGILTILLFGLLLCLVFWSYKHHTNLKSFGLYALIVLASVSAGIGVYLGSVFGEFASDSLFGDKSYSTSLLGPEIQEAAIWLRNNSQATDVFATNYLCDSKTVPFGKTPNDVPLCWQQNTQALISSISQRSAFIESPLFGSVGNELNEDESWRYNISNQFPKSADCSLPEQLIESNVAWFVMDRSKPESLTFCHSVAVVFRNATTKIFRLD